MLRWSFQWPKRQSFWEYGEISLDQCSFIALQTYWLMQMIIPLPCPMILCATQPSECGEYVPKQMTVAERPLNVTYSGGDGQRANDCLRTKESRLQNAYENNKWRVTSLRHIQGKYDNISDQLEYWMLRKIQFYEWNWYQTITFMYGVTLDLPGSG